MSDVKTINSLESIKIAFDALLNNIDKVIKEVRPRSDIRKTELFKLKKELSKIEELESHKIALISEIVTKYLSINELFIGNIEYKKENFLKIIQRTKDVTDSAQSYNDHLFELSMGVRIAKALKDHKTEIHIDGDSGCDVIVNDTIAIECKYIHEKSGILGAIRTAKEQIDTRVKDGHAKYGYIAIDLSNICPREKINQFVEYTLERFIQNYECLAENQFITENIIDDIISDRNFFKIFSSYIAHEMESLFYSELGFSYDLGENVYAILFQFMNTFCFEYQDKVLPLTSRGMPYFINRNFDENKYRATEGFIHSLAVGV
ncbi:hypothetical protein [Morganella psychrotolerans]|uniref:hypothetical protein n=1 Tax=Morganella psychrotolerans TaxID=368603 RepID=UPI0039AFA396